MTLPPDHPPVAARQIGVLLINLGTPDAPDTRSVRAYLREFLSDRRVVEIPAFIWQPVLRGFILNTRPQKSAANYRKVWGPEGSPLAAITRRQALALQDMLGPTVKVDWAMRYGSPSIEQAMRAMIEAGCDRILLAPLYPQYCAATTATANDKAFDLMRALRWQPAVRTLPPYYDDPGHIEALRASITQGLAGLDFAPDAIVVSFHGMPQRTLTLGDPYHCQCQKTGRLLGEALGRPVIVSFQSRFGSAKWLDPATDETLAALPGKGVNKVVVVAPGFSADCLETLEEIAMEGRETFHEAGGGDFAYLPCLNDSPIGMQMLRDLIVRELEGWWRPA
ncbi:ferrochelatase [Sphingomonas sp.]|uniref:ferrochelatase n=1 Tax=Sphingomonas sp. TaxID=28214 RepID=UPI001D5793A0|nr:ferrochelatase [Sphingomonas sp.]MBX9796873.1 ferrochelatase [Sphingomonas sp.]